MSTLVELDDVVPVTNLGYLVRSKSLSQNGATAWRLVRGDTCDCEAGVYGAKTCRHRRLVAEWCKRKAAEYAPRPKADTNRDWFS